MNILRWMVLVFCCSLIACSKNPFVQKELVICTSFYPLYVATLNITKNVPEVRVINMSPVTTGCLHDYQLTPHDLKKLSQAQAFIITGTDMENFTEKIRKQMPHLKIIQASRNIPRIQDEEMEHHEEHANPHTWVGISNMIQIVQNITEDLAQIDPPHVTQYAKNAQDYIARLEEIREKIRAKVALFSDRKIVTFHEAFAYFAQEFGLQVVGVITQKPSTEPNPNEIANTVDKIKMNNVKALFAEPQYSSQSAEIIARETGLKVHTLDPVTSGPTEPPDVYEAYEKAMEKNLQSLQDALQ